MLKLWELVGSSLVARRPRGTRNGSTNAKKRDRDHGQPLRPGFMDSCYDQTEKQFRFAEQPEPKAQTRVSGEGKQIVTAWVITAQGWNVIKLGCLDHVGVDVTAKVCDLLSNVTEESITGPPTQEHDGVNRDVVKMHGHGSGGPA